MAYGSILGQNPMAQNTLYNNAQTSSIITANNVQGAIDQIVSNISSESLKIIMGTYQGNGSTNQTINLPIPTKIFAVFEGRRDNYINIATSYMDSYQWIFYLPDIAGTTKNITSGGTYDFTVTINNECTQISFGRNGSGACAYNIANTTYYYLCFY